MITVNLSLSVDCINFTGANWDGPGPYFPTGLALGPNASSLFPRISAWRAADLRQAVLTSWTNGWFTSHFDLQDALRDNGTTLVFGPRGGVQGGRGWHFDASVPGPIRICSGNVRENDCGPVKIEGIFAELDAPNEYVASQMLSEPNSVSFAFKFNDVYC